MSLFTRLVAGALALGVVTSASATQYVTNGDFSQTDSSVGSGSRQMSNDYVQGSSTQNGAQYVTGWNNAFVGKDSNNKYYAGYSFLMTGATQATTQNGVQTNDNGPLSLYAATNSSTIGGSGGNFIGADGAYETGLIYQVITGLTAGKQYDLSFNFAGAQQSGFTGDTTENWTVYWGTDTNNYVSTTTQTLNDASHGFTGWYTYNYTFTATSSSEILGFLAGGTPNGQPPFSLLDDVSLTDHVAAAVPEPASWAMMIAGFGLVGASLRKRRGAAFRFAA